MEEDKVEVEVKDSILNSVKKSLGILPEQKEFDIDIIMFINSAIATLTQIGVGSSEGFTVEDENNTYDEWLGETDGDWKNLTKTYLCYKTRLGFDPPQNSTVISLMKENLAELEWRLHVQNDPPDTFESGGEISK